MDLRPGCLAAFVLLMLLHAHGVYGSTIARLAMQTAQGMPGQLPPAAAVNPPAAAGAGSMPLTSTGRRTISSISNAGSTRRTPPKQQAGSAAARAALASNPYGPVARRSSGLQFTFHLHKPFYYPENILPGVQIYFLDWSTPQEVVRSLRAAKHFPICYFTSGAWEPHQPDANWFVPSDLGNPISIYPGQRYLNIRSGNVRYWMLQRIKTCQSKGFVGIHFDGTDFYTGDHYPAWNHEKTGHNLSEADQVDYLRFLARETHARNMGWGLLNSQMLIPHIDNIIDWYVNEACFTYKGDCERYENVTRAGKPVYHINYTPSDFQQACSPRGRAMNFTSILTDRKLNGCPWEDCNRKLC